MPSNPFQNYQKSICFSIFLHSAFSLNSHLDSSPSTIAMKKSGILAASVAAASATAASLSSSTHQDDRRTGENASSQNSSSSSTEKFAPRFDGLRFIETLVTAHR